MTGSGSAALIGMLTLPGNAAGAARLGAALGNVGEMLPGTHQ